MTGLVKGMKGASALALVFGVAASLTSGGCSDDPATGFTSGTGGASTSTGGKSATGAAISSSTGGKASGGTSSAAGGASSATGGASAATGGTASGGTSSAAGGTSAATGGTASGGTSSAAGGTSSAGGASSSTGGAGSEASAEAMAFCTAYEAVPCTYGEAPMHYVNLADCTTKFDAYSADRKICVVMHAENAGEDPTVHCPHAAGQAPCN